MMKNFKRLLSSLLVVFSILIATPLQANAAWKNDSQGWWYTSGSKYLTGWQSLDGNWYYFYGNGYMAHDCWIGDYYLNSNGAWTLDIPTQTTTATTNSTAVTNNQNNSQVCYLSATGSKYHRINNCGRMNPNKATQTTVSNAEAQGYGKCSKCW